MKSFEQKSRESYNRIASDYDNTLEGRFTERFKELLKEETRLQPGSSILDVACGNGRLLKMLSEQNEIRGYGIDISEQMVEHAKIKYPKFQFCVSSCDKTPFEERTFDAITVSAAYHHFPDVKSFAKEAVRLLKPQGTIYIAEVHYPLFLRIILNPFFPLSKAGDVKVYSPKEIKDNFESHG
jgi:ubiquinone/menaquinone biosynthesis C-methylase UbiE